MFIKEKEIWREFPLNVQDCDSNYRIEFSNYGKVRTYNSQSPNGKMIKGSLQGGFPIVRITLFKKKTTKHLEKIQQLQEKIDALNASIKNLSASRSNKEKKQQLRAERDEITKERVKINTQFDKRRKIYIAILIHKAVAELFLEQPHDKDQKFIIHKDFDKTNNHVNNLAWASQEELNARSKQHPKNVLHAFKKQFEPKKINVKFSKLNENDVLFIKKRLKKGDTLNKLANRFNVSDMQIHRIKTGENWGHVKLIEDLILEK